MLTLSSRATGIHPRRLWPHVLGTGQAHRQSHSGCQGPGAPALRGSQRRLPCTHQRGNLCVPPRAAPSQLETLKAALAPGVGWAGMGPPTHIPPQAVLGCSKALLSYSKTPLCSTYILLGQRGRRMILPCRGAGEAAQKGSSPCTGSPRDTQTLSPTARGVKGGSRAHSEPQALTQARRG